MKTEIQATTAVLGPNFDAVSADAALVLQILNLPSNAAILDVGTGSGNFAIYLAMQGYQVLTGEPSTDQSQYARRDWAVTAQKAGVLDKIRFQSFDASELPFPAEAYDAVFFFGVLHHIPEHLRPAVLREALRIAKSSGVVVFFEPRAAMLERVRATDPDHPPAANPSEYLTDSNINQQRIEGAWMDIFLYHKTVSIVAGDN